MQSILERICFLNIFDKKRIFPSGFVESKLKNCHRSTKRFRAKLLLWLEAMNDKLMGEFLLENCQQIGENFLDIKVEILNFFSFHKMKVMSHEIIKSTLKSPSISEWTCGRGKVPDEEKLVVKNDYPTIYLTHYINFSLR